MVQLFALSSHSFSTIDPSPQRGGFSPLIIVTQIRESEQPSKRDHVNPAPIRKADILQSSVPFNHNVQVEEPSNCAVISQPIDIRPKDHTKWGLLSKAPCHRVAIGTFNTNDTIPSLAMATKFKPDAGTVAAQPISE
jgi:hypothetical protein